MADEVTVTEGKLIHAKISNKINSRIEKGTLAAVHAIVVHQTGASTAASSFSSYDSGNNGAHFLIDIDGSIFQTARINQRCWHVGQIRSRCQEMKSCTSDELKVINALLFKKGESYAMRIKAVHAHESDKNYPDRYPTNEDSLGIEIVGMFDAKGQTYDTVNKEQNDSLAWLVAALEAQLKLTEQDVFTHGAIGYKQPSEASTAQWKKSP
jgi:N-acetyl-anhydromuramyl-L-alanine amidase AmpD